MSLSTSALELRCPTPHPSRHGWGKQGQSCNRLLAKYEPGRPFDIEMACPRCEQVTTFEIRPTSSTRCGSTRATV